MPKRESPKRPLIANARAESNAAKAAIVSARAQSKGKSLEQLNELIAVEYDKHGVAKAPYAVELQAELLLVEQQSFGRLRRTVATLGLLKSGGAAAIQLIKIRSQQGPAWLRPPDRASYPMVTGRDRYTSVELDDGAEELLTQVRAEAPKFAYDAVLVSVWLKPDALSGRLAVYVGDHRVGLVPQEDTRQFDAALRAAALFDEDMFVQAKLAVSRATGRYRLEFPLPVSQ